METDGAWLGRHFHLAATSGSGRTRAASVLLPGRVEGGPELLFEDPGWRKVEVRMWVWDVAIRRQSRAAID